MWTQRTAGHAEFADAKRLAVFGSGLAVLNWFLGFLVIGGTLVTMGQAEGMEGAMRGASNMAMLSFLTLIYLSMAEPTQMAE